MASLFAKLFAPGRWDSTDAERTTAARASLAGGQIDADSNVITVRQSSSFNSFPSSGTAHLGGCAVTYSGKGTQATTNTGGYPDVTLGTLTGCVIGEYSAITNPKADSSTSFGKTIKFPTEEDWTASDVGGGPVVSTVPYSWLGRRVALYVTTWDDATGAWHDVDDAEMVWSGRISDAIQFDPRRSVWRLSCESGAADFDQQIMASSPTARICGINLNSTGTWGRAWRINEYYQGGLVAFRDCSISAGYYTPEGLAKCLQTQMNEDSAWTDIAGTGGHAASFLCHIHRVGGDWEFAVYSTTTEREYVVVPEESPDDPHDARNPCHAWNALGFGFDPFSVDTNNGGKGKTAGGRGYHHYHPLDLRYNGHKLLILENGADYLWSSQGDYGATLAYVHCKTAKLNGSKEGPYIAAYTARTASTTVYSVPSENAVAYASATVLTLAGGYLQPPGDVDPRGFVGGEEWDAFPEVRNCYVPTWRDSDGRLRGPFEALLYPMISTGTTDYNGSTYDKLPVELSVSIPSRIVNASSFLDADREVLSCYPSLALRRFYPIVKATSFRELLERECKLFGYTLSWKAGQWTLVNAMHPNAHDVAATLDDSNTACFDDWPVIDMSWDTAINRWVFELDYDYTTDKYHTTINLKDAEAAWEGCSVRERKLQHPGVMPQKSSFATRALVQLKAQDEMYILRRPWQVVRRTLSPDLMTLLAVGDVVTYQVATSTHPDPMGSGAMTCDGSAVVLGNKWNFDSSIGAATLMVVGRSASRVTPWCPAAVINNAATNGGWDSTNSLLTLVAGEYRTHSSEPDDGYHFAASDKILVHQRAPSDPTAPTFTPVELTVSEYHSVNSTLEVSENSITGYDTTGETEYFVTFADYGNASGDQQTNRGSWQASVTTHLLNAADRAEAHG